MYVGVYLSLGKAIGVQNNTCASISGIGSSLPHQLACVTDKKLCCLSQGQWHYPSGSQLRQSSESSRQNYLFFVERTNEEVLTCFDSAMLWSLMESSVAELLMLWISITLCKVSPSRLSLRS